MAFVVGRVLALWLAMASGGLGGYLLARVGTPSAAAQATAALLGAALLVTVWAVLGRLGAWRVFRWLQGGGEGAAPQLQGAWGEVAHRAERALRQRERQRDASDTRLSQFLAAIQASPNGVLMLDEGDHITWMNTAACQHLGLDAARDLLQPATNLVRTPAFVSYLQQRQWAEPLTFASPTGRGALSVLARRYGESQTLLLTQDITDRQRADAMRRDFVANVSHEIRTPLTVLAGAAETMASLPLAAAERDRLLTLMRQQAERMQTLVADLLTLAQLEARPLPLLERWLPLAPLLQRIKEEGERLSAGRHALRFEPPPAGLEVAALEAELHSAITNLVANAVRYTPEGGRITLRWVDMATRGGALEVSDTGIGIPAVHLPRLGERFYRVDGSRSRDTGGTGLGLAIVKHVMQRHGGELQMESEPGVGSSFRLRLPAARLRQAVPAGAALGAETA